MQQRIMEQKELPQHHQKLVNFLQNAGYQIADRSGRQIINHRMVHKNIGILWDDPDLAVDKPTFGSCLRWLLGKEQPAPRKRFLAVIWPAPVSVQFGVGNDTWVIEHHCPGLTSRINQLAMKISDEFGVAVYVCEGSPEEILVNPRDEKSLFELFYSDIE